MDPSCGIDVDAVVIYLNALTEVRRNLLYKLLSVIILILWSMNDRLGVVSPSTDKVTNIVLK